MKNFGTLFLLPAPLGENSLGSIPNGVIEAIHKMTHFVVEREKTARRVLKLYKHPVAFDDLTFYEFNKDSTPDDAMDALQDLISGQDVGILSEAGMPGIADPGAVLVEMAHQNKISVKPFVGPSSILLALVGSGLNGQSFTFHGYLPLHKGERKRELKHMEMLALKSKQTQLFMETPYRNRALLDDIVTICRDTTLLCIACELTTPNEYIVTKPVSEWKKGKPDINKRPAIFAIGVPYS